MQGRLLPECVPVSGYEIHAGVSNGPALKRPAVRLDDGRCDGAISTDGQILGTYLHGLFENERACAALLHWAGLETVEAFDYHGLRERDIERLADLGALLKEHEPSLREHAPKPRASMRIAPRI